MVKKAGKKQHLTAGNPGNSGGKKGRSGRPSSDFRTACKNIADKYKFLEMLAEIAIGNLGEKWIDKRGETQYDETSNSDRIKAIELVLAYGEGRPTQPLQHELTPPHKIVLHRHPGTKMGDANGNT